MSRDSGNSGNSVTRVSVEDVLVPWQPVQPRFDLGSLPVSRLAVLIASGEVLASEADAELARRSESIAAAALALRPLPPLDHRQLASGEKDEG